MVPAAAAVVRTQTQPVVDLGIGMGRAFYEQRDSGRDVNGSYLWSPSHAFGGLRGYLEIKPGFCGIRRFQEIRTILA